MNQDKIAFSGGNFAIYFSKSRMGQALPTFQDRRDLLHTHASGNRGHWLLQEVVHV